MPVGQISEAFEKWKVESERKVDIVEKMQSLAKADPVHFLESQYGWYHIQTGLPIQWQEWEKILIDKILKSKKKRRAICDIKKNLKTCKSAAIALVNAWSRPNSQQYIIGNKLKQSESRAFEFLVTAIKLNPYVCKIVEVKESKNKIIFPNGAKIEALAQDAAGEAGADPFCVIFDEVWGFIYKRNYEMVEEFTIPPTQPEGFQLFTSYAGYDVSSKVLKDIYDGFFDEHDNVLPGVNKIDVDEDFYWCNEDYESNEFPLYENESTLMYWSNGPINGHPGQQHHTREYFEDQKDTLRTKKFMQLHENKWTSGADDAILEQHWRECRLMSLTIVTLEDGNKTEYRVPSNINTDVPLYVGVDGATINDHAFVTSVYPYQYIENMLAIGPWKGWAPGLIKEPGMKKAIRTPIDLDEVEQYIYWLDENYWVKLVAYDPTQLHQMMTRVKRAFGEHRVIEFSQSTPNLIKAADTIFTLLKYMRLIVPQDKRLLWYAGNAIGKATASGSWIINKDEGKKKIDFIVALSFACKFANEELDLFQGQRPEMNDMQRRIADQLRKQESRFADSFSSEDEADVFNGHPALTAYGNDLMDSLNGLKGF